MRGGYETADAHQREIAAVYGAIASLIRCEPDEVAITSNATESWQLGLHSLALEPGDRILTGEAEYASNFISFLKLRDERGVTVDVIPSDDQGATSAEALRGILDDRVRLISLTHIPTNGGLINPAAAIGRVANEHGIPYLLDACQSIGQIDIDVRGIGCDMLSATGRKFLRGPRGTGFLFVRRQMLERSRPPFLDLHGATWTSPNAFEMRPDARRYETWEFNVASLLGLGAAARYALDLGMPAIEARATALGAGLRERLSTLPAVTVHDIGQHQGAIVSFSVAGLQAEDVQARLAAAGVAVSVSTPNSTLLDAVRRGLPTLVRASPHYFNTEHELDTTLGHVARLA